MRFSSLLRLVVVTSALAMMVPGTGARAEAIPSCEFGKTNWTATFDSSWRCESVGEIGFDVHSPSGVTFHLREDLIFNPEDELVRPFFDETVSFGATINPACEIALDTGGEPVAYQSPTHGFLVVECGGDEFTDVFYRYDELWLVDEDKDLHVLAAIEGVESVDEAAAVIAEFRSGMTFADEAFADDPAPFGSDQGTPVAA